MAAARTFLKGRKEMTFYEGMRGLFELAIISVKNTEFTVTSEVELKDNHSNGVIIAQGGRFGGVGDLLMKDGKPVYEQQFPRVGALQGFIERSHPGWQAHHRLPFVRDDPKKLGSGGKGVLSVDGNRSPNSRHPKMVYGVFAFDDGLGIGVDDETKRVARLQGR